MAMLDALLSFMGKEEGGGGKREAWWCRSFFHGKGNGVICTTQMSRHSGYTYQYLCLRSDFVFSE